MDREQYAYLANVSRLRFEFTSIGPKGAIKKQVRFRARDSGDLIFNLGFGDLNEETDELDDFTISNNGDKDKVLATVAAAVIDFTCYFPQAFVYAKGSTQVRTRLYRMAIFKNLKEIEVILYVYGLKENSWTKFEPYCNYEAFMVLRK